MAVWTFLFLISIHIFDTGTPVFTVYDDKFVSILYRRKKVIGYCTWNWLYVFWGKNGRHSKTWFSALMGMFSALKTGQPEHRLLYNFLSVLYHAWESYRLLGTGIKLWLSKSTFKQFWMWFCMLFAGKRLHWFRLHWFLFLCMPEKVISYLEMSYEIL